MSKNEENKVLEGLKELQDTVQSKSADTAEAKQKIETISKELGDIQEANQKKFEAVEAEKQALETEVATVKEEIKELTKKALRSGVDSNAISDAKSKYSKQLDAYLRRGLEIETSVVEDMAREFVEKSAHGKSEDLSLVQKAMVSGSSADGGYLIIPDRSKKEITRIFESSPVRAVAGQVTTTSDVVEMLINDDAFASGGWIGEEDSRFDTATAKLHKLSIHVHEQFAMPSVTQKMIDDASINLENFITNQVDSILTRTENTAFVSGDGAQKPKGFLSYDAWTTNGVYERNKLEQINSGVNGDLTATSLIKLQNSLLEQHQSSAVFMMNRSVWESILTLQDSNNNFYINHNMLTEGAPLTLLGKPVYFASDVPAKANDSLSVVYGNFKQGYTIVDRLGIRVVRDTLTNKPNTKFYTTKRVGGAVTDYQAIKILKLSE